jgi:hypothetical protein
MAVEPIEFRRAVPADFSAILTLQSSNFIGHLRPEERGKGFLSAELTRDQLAEIGQDLALLVACRDGLILGYLCATTCDYGRRIPVVAAMLNTFGHVSFNSKPLSSYNSFVYGPGCIDRPARGRGILLGLFRRLLTEVEHAYEIGVALVAKDNRRSLEAHVNKLGMAAVGEFQFHDHGYVTLAFNVASDPSGIK